ncbi:hypothetical protein Q4566_01660 [Tamlana sp. 2_MG-2023]|uniref:hypothetical protein n=1 Tax=unclassified Tamlana TaxID=2614803 RepID=UPI0026E470A5|nr:MULTISPECIES: hypothetical protein [unclassified Tamlana]MDO6758890.1 hypothetical protein [Tamlana sp. 2_MG-2023]MDO6789589.1 hypothetical protein [Tamlana sp. 1_MG-2023]
MNNILKNTRKGFLMLALFGTMASFADAPADGIIVEGNNTTLTLNYAKQGSAVSIKDTNGSVLYTETIETTGRYKKNFDLTFLPDGNYLFEVDKDLEINEIPFTLNSGVAVFNKNEEKVVYKPFLRVSNDLVYISKLNLDNEDLDVNIYFTKNNSMNSQLVVSEKIKSTNNIEKVYKLEDLGQGRYKIVLNSAGRTVEKNI